jgi:predicted ribosome quality control (RQC) complex YloA/Tae2 family protein
MNDFAIRMETSREVLAMGFRGCHNTIEESKYQHGLLREEVLKQQVHYEKVAKDMDRNTQALLRDIRANRELANQLIGKVEEQEIVLKRTIQDVEKGKDWSKTMEDGVLIMMSERMEKMEKRMAEQEEEMIELRRQVGGSCLRLVSRLTRSPLVLPLYAFVGCGSGRGNLF